MRIISGDKKGLRFNGRVPENVRPTADAVRESIFNVLSNLLDFDGMTVADICAGTGSLGFEALSRGADLCYFFEKNRKSIEYINSAAKHLKFDGTCYEIIPGDVKKTLLQFKSDFPNTKFDLVFTDPPYIADFLDNLIADITSLDLLEDGALLIFEHASNISVVVPAELNLIRRKAFGMTVVDIYGYGIETGNEEIPQH